MNEHPPTSDFESMRALAIRLLAEYRAKKEHREFCALVEKHERERVALNLTPKDHEWLRKLRTRV